MSSTFSEELLKIYYQRLFPYSQMFNWLSYGNGKLCYLYRGEMRPLYGGYIALYVSFFFLLCLIIFLFCDSWSLTLFLNLKYEAPDDMDPLVERDFFLKREFSFTLEDDIYVRYQSFRDEQELKERIVECNPFKIDIGAVFTSSV